MLRSALPNHPLHHRQLPRPRGPRACVGQRPVAAPQAPLHHAQIAALHRRCLHTVVSSTRPRPWAADHAVSTQGVHNSPTSAAVGCSCIIHAVARRPTHSPQGAASRGAVSAALAPPPSRPTPPPPARGSRRRPPCRLPKLAQHTARHTHDYAVGFSGCRAAEGRYIGIFERARVATAPAWHDWFWHNFKATAPATGPTPIRMHAHVLGPNITAYWYMLIECSKPIPLWKGIAHLYLSLSHAY